jgi:small subunit ribosomal protein S17
VASLKTVVVEVARTVKHSDFKKYVSRKNTFLIHDEEGRAQVGDKITFKECRPISKSKRWTLSTIIKRSSEEVGGVQ